MNNIRIFFCNTRHGYNHILLDLLKYYLSLMTVHFVYAKLYHVSSANFGFSLVKITNRSTLSVLAFPCKEPLVIRSIHGPIKYFHTSLSRVLKWKNERGKKKKLRLAATCLRFSMQFFMSHVSSSSRHYTCKARRRNHCE